MKVKKSISQKRTAANIAKCAENVHMIVWAINRWADAHAGKVPRVAQQNFSKYRTLLLGQVLELKSSLHSYDAALAAALDSAEAKRKA
jgi:hypothetical protein